MESAARHARDTSCLFEGRTSSEERVSPSGSHEETFTHCPHDGHTVIRVGFRAGFTSCGLNRHPQTRWQLSPEPGSLNHDESSSRAATKAEWGWRR